jgi:hypothetical protein
MAITNELRELPQTAICPDVSPSAYHRDPCKAISLSASIAIKLVTECPIKAWEAHPRLGNEPSKPNRQMELGTMCHSRCSGVQSDIVVIDAKDYRTKAAQQARDDARHAGKIPILIDEQGLADEIADAAIETCKAAGINLSGHWERVIMWDDDGVQCRGMLDHIDLDAPYILDLKTCTNANPADLGKKIVDEGYDIQAAAYIRAAEKIRPDLAGRIPFLFCFVETTGKHLASIVQPDESMLHLGRMRWKRAKRIWRKCLETNEWPGWPGGIQTVYPTNYQIQEAQMDLDIA